MGMKFVRINHRRWVFFAALVCAAVCLAHTEAEEDAFLQDLMQIYDMSSENADCIEDVAEGRVDGQVRFLTALDLFEYQFRPDVPYANWSVELRESAFKNAVRRLSQKTASQMSEDEISSLDLVFVFCQAVNYTNCLEEAHAIVCGTNSPARWSAHDYLFDLSVPSIVMNEVALTISTNVVDYNKSERRKYIERYVTNLLRSDVVDEVRRDAASRFYSTRAIHELYYELNPLLISVDSNYDTSTNQLYFALEALRLPNIEGRRKSYFEAITNRLGRAIAP